ncbi:MAG: hypothetical protein ACE361_26330 [Aureliella sp.]
MRIYHEMVKQECERRGISMQELLRAAGVSSNAYYSLVSKESALPKSVQKIAQALDIAPSMLLHDEKLVLQKHIRLLERVNEIAEKHPDADRDTIRHTLTLLREPPIDRLRRALELGRIGLSN